MTANEKQMTLDFISTLETVLRESEIQCIVCTEENIHHFMVEDKITELKELLSEHSMICKSCGKEFDPKDYGDIYDFHAKERSYCSSHCYHS